MLTGTNSCRRPRRTILPVDLFIPAPNVWHALSINEYMYLASRHLSSLNLQGPPTLNYPTFIEQRDYFTVLLEIAKEYRRIYRIGTEWSDYQNNFIRQITARCFQVRGSHASHTFNPEWNPTHTIPFLA